tara:strand:+ start:129004 stop:129606 length:603 start_codon:yes stop_codon:yes gene_type:complete
MYRLIFFIGLFLLLVSGCISSSFVKKEPEFGDRSFYNFTSRGTAGTVLHPYDKLLGDWRCQVLSKTNDIWVKDTAFWSFRTILDDTVIQDFWFNPAPSSNGKKQDFLGTNIRTYNTGTNQWSVVWIANDSNKIQGPWISYENENGEILIRDATNNWEIKFYDIQKDQFLWQWKTLKDSVWEITTKIKAMRAESSFNRTNF